MTSGDSALSILLSVLAVAVSAIAVHTSFRTARRQHTEEVHQYLGVVWNDILTMSHASPAYVDILKTEAFDTLMTDTERSQYDVYCFKVWGHVQQIVAKEFHQSAQFRAIIHWTVAYHLRWLEQNPTFFPLPQFWKAIEIVKNEPQLISRYRALPQKSGDIDWDIVCDDYHSYILGPFAPEMTQPDASGHCRNLLLDDLLALPSGMLGGATIADFGCGPGHLMEYLSGKVKHLTGVDRSQASLDRAGLTAAKAGVEFVSINADIRKLALDRTFDVIITSNAILPQTRADVRTMLSVIKKHLAPDGQVMAIMPSYDTTLYLRDLWRQHYTELLGDAEHANRIVRALATAKRADDTLHRYADDGRSIQCYHTKDSMQREFADAGFRFVKEPRKLRYPWELCRRFDYGYFPEASEEIWDWYVIATHG